MKTPLATVAASAVAAALFAAAATQLYATALTGNRVALFALVFVAAALTALVALRVQGRQRRSAPDPRQRRRRRTPRRRPADAATEADRRLERERRRPERDERRPERDERRHGRDEGRHGRDEGRPGREEGRPGREEGGPKRDEDRPEREERKLDREEGTVKWFDASKGYGFVVRSDGSEIFVHFRSIRQRGEERPVLTDGQSISFVAAKRRRGWQAEDVVPC